MRSVIFQDWGRIDFEAAWNKQTVIKNEIIELKRADKTKKNQFIFCSHDPIYTIGKSGSSDNLKIDDEELDQIGLKALKINRGGDITYHGPGQIVGYPILDLDEFFTDIHKYIRFIEEVIIRRLRDFGIIAQRFEGYTGVWIDSRDNGYEKICAIGVHLSRWVTMHGFALNVSTNLDYFDHIIPCGIDEQDKRITSMEKLKGEPIDHEMVKESIRFHFSNLFKIANTISD